VADKRRGGIRLFQADPLCGKPFSNAMTCSVLKGFHDLWLREKESRVPVDLPILIIAGTEDPVGGKTATRFAMSAQVEGINDAALGRQEAGELVVSSAVVICTVARGRIPTGGSHLRTKTGA
jgi:hypothetical protein